MKKDGITVHCLVKNEEKWVWFAINSVLDIADRVLIFDTGSTDKTVEIIKTIKSKKIIFEEKGNVDAKGLVDLRKEQLKRTDTNWFMILDGDEIWPKKTKKELAEKLKKAKKEDLAVVIRAWNFVGDVFHYHPESIHYHWPYAPKDYQGWANLRLLRKSIPGLGIKGEYPLEYYHDSTGTPIQNYGQKHLIFLINRYFHSTYLIRSENRRADKSVLNRLKKGKYELGISFQKSTVYPEVFYKPGPSIVADPFVKRGLISTGISAFQSPIKELKRKLLNLYNP